MAKRFPRFITVCPKRDSASHVSFIIHAIVYLYPITQLRMLSLIERF